LVHRKELLDVWKELLVPQKDLLDVWKELLVPQKDLLDVWKELFDVWKELLDLWKQVEPKTNPLSLRRDNRHPSGSIIGERQRPPINSLTRV
jgi:hypothetical protein